MRTVLIILGGWLILSLAAAYAIGRLAGGAPPLRPTGRRLAVAATAVAAALAVFALTASRIDVPSLREPGPQLTPPGTSPDLATAPPGARPAPLSTSPPGPAFALAASPGAGVAGGSGFTPSGTRRGGTSSAAPAAGDRRAPRRRPAGSSGPTAPGAPPGSPAPAGPPGSPAPASSSPAPAPSARPVSGTATGDAPARTRAPGRRRPAYRGGGSDSPPGAGRRRHRPDRPARTERRRGRVPAPASDPQGNAAHGVQAPPDHARGGGAPPGRAPARRGRGARRLQLAPPGLAGPSD